MPQPVPGLEGEACAPRLSSLRHMSQPRESEGAAPDALAFLHDASVEERVLIAGHLLDQNDASFFEETILSALGASLLLLATLRRAVLCYMFVCVRAFLRVNA